MAGSNIEEIKAYKTSDGTIFIDKEAANKYEPWSKLQQELDDLIQSDFDLTRDDKVLIYEYIIENYEEIYFILKPYIKNIVGSKSF